MQIEIDFDVFKALTAHRVDERDSINDVLRRVMELGGQEKASLAPSSQNASGCVFKGVHFPDGTQLRATYKGKVYRGEIKNGEWRDEVGNAYSSPSNAAWAITQGGVNGWTFWECKRPADEEWVRIVTLRADYMPLEAALA